MWFKEGITNALNKSRTEQRILLVYIESKLIVIVVNPIMIVSIMINDQSHHSLGDNDASKAMTEQLESDTSIRTLVGEKTIALKLAENSNEAKMFNQIYAFKPSPTVYLVSYLGELQTTFTDQLDKTAFVEHLKGANNSSTNQPDDKSTEAAASVAQSSVQASKSSTTQNAQADNRTIEEKRTELIERIKEKNKQQEEQRAKNSEMERIRSGKEIQKLRKEHEQREQAELIKQREKDALLDKIERERILRQIEEDHQEKKARFELERLKREEEYSQYQKQQASKSTLKNRIAVKLGENEIKIQFKLPDSEALICKFKQDDTLQSAIDYVKENSDLTSFRLALTFPKRTFDSKDFSSTFSELGIKNSAVLLILADERFASPTSRTAVTANYSFIDKFYQIILSIYTILFSLITGLFSSLFGSGNAQAARPADNHPSTDNQQPPNARRGFRSTFDRDDDRTNTYNGNSTEQQ